MKELSEYLESIGISKEDQIRQSKCFVIALVTFFSLHSLSYNYNFSEGEKAYQNKLNKEARALEVEYKLENGIPEDAPIEKVFYPGEHIVRVNATEYIYDKNDEYWPEDHDGYMLVDHDLKKSKNPFVKNEHIFYFSNRAEVVATGHFVNEYGLTLHFDEFGTPVKQATLGLK